MLAIMHFLSTAAAMKLTGLRLDKGKLLSNRELLVCFIFGLLPDIDLFLQVISFLFLGNLPFHRAFTHNLFIPIILCVIALILRKRSIFFASIAYSVHIILDLLLGSMMLLFPFSTRWIGMHCCYMNPNCATIATVLDAVALLVWLVYRTIKVKS